MVEFSPWKMFRSAQSTQFMPLEHFASGSKLISVRNARLFFLLQLNLNDCLLCIPMNHLKLHRWPVWLVCIFAMQALSYNGNSSFIFAFARKKRKKKERYLYGVKKIYAVCTQTAPRMVSRLPRLHATEQVLRLSARMKALQFYALLFLFNLVL